MRVPNPFGRRFRRVLGLLLIVVLCAAPYLSARGAATEDSSADAPFGLGEKFIFAVEWNPPWFFFFLPTMGAGDVEVEMAEEMEYEGRKAYRIVFNARSSGTFANLVGMKINDQFVYITDARTFCTLRGTERIREGKRMRDVDVVYLPDTNRLHVREVDLSVTPNKVNKDEYKENIPSCVRDVFSALYTIRQREFNVGMTEKVMVGNADKVKEVQSVVEKKDVVVTPMGKFEAWRLNTVALLGSLFREGGQFRMWLSADARKMPVQFEAKVRLGKVTGKLKAASLPPLANPHMQGGP